jgi:hypothetical protein
MTHEELARHVREWRGRIPVRLAAEMLGIPKRTFDNIEQGRGFPYPRLLLTALEANKERIQRETETTTTKGF